MSDTVCCYNYSILDVAKVDFRKRISCSETVWDKANEAHIAAYRELLCTKLSDITLLHTSLLCDDVCCTNTDHTYICSLNTYANQIAAAWIS